LSKTAAISAGLSAAAANQTLSEKRAQAVVRWLVAHDISDSRLMAKGLGQTTPVADNATAEARAKNRRIAITILPDELIPVETAPAPAMKLNTETNMMTNAVSGD